MFTINGRVISSEHGSGLANLNVVLYDIDPALRDRAQQVARLAAGKPERLWAEIPGQRLGSVMTGPDGMFRLEFDASAFAKDDCECRPDLVLLVLAPEEVRVDDCGRPTSIPAQERLLYCSQEAVTNAGRTESFVIRLPAALLQSRGVIAPSAQRVTNALAAIEASSRDDEQIQLAVEAASVSTVRRLAKPILARQKQVQQAFEGFTLSSLTQAQRDSSNYVGAHEGVLPKQEALFDAQMHTIAVDTDAAVTRQFRLEVDDAELRAWGIETAADAVSFSAEMTAGQVLAGIKQRVRFGPLDRSRSWLEIECAELDAESVLDEAIARCTSKPALCPPGDGSEPDPSTLTAELISSQIAGQLRHQTAPEIELQYGVEQHGKVTATITRPSPADITRYHDFYDLQIAFEHVWTEAVDEGLPVLFKELYGEMVRFQNRVSGETIVRRVQTLDDMLSLYEEFRSLKEAMEAEEEAVPEPPRPVDASVATAYPEVTPQLWAVATSQEKQQLRDLAAKHADLHDYDVGDGAADFFSGGWNAVDRERAKVTNAGRARAVINTLQQRLRTQSRPTPPPRSTPGNSGASVSGSRLEQLFREIDVRLAEPYKFDIFARNSVNYGVMLTYRQQWVPLDYQVGSLVSTIPLAPKETRQYSTKRIVKRTRSEKRLEDREQSSRRERNSTSRADAEIVRQARDKTSFEQTANATVDVGVFKGEFGTRFGVESEKSSSQTKKNFREAVLKATDEFKEKHTLEVSTATSDELEVESSGTISNPNDEITVTYLFYELQRQFEISERLQRLTPVVLVANDVPRPDAVDEDWLLTHQWILERALLDESLRPSMAYLTNGMAGDQLALEALRASVDRQIDLVEELTRLVAMKTKLAEDAFAELKDLLTQPEKASQLKDIGMALALGPLALAAGGGDDEAAEKREEVTKMALERADANTQEVNARMTREVTALNESIDKYVRALQQHFDHQLGITKLRLHIKQNILYYMQAIWDHEPTDQRYFRLYNIEVPWIEANDPSWPIQVEGRRIDRSGKSLGWEVSIPLRLTGAMASMTPMYRRTTRRLHQIADLDNLLGYKGNYMIFPAREHSFLHLYMMQDYVDENGGVRDPDGPGYSQRELLDYICCLARRAPQRLESERERLLGMVRERLTSPKAESERVVVPTDSLFIEALPGTHPVMEQFKVVHRALDVKKVQGEVREMELENLRLAARLLAGDLGDPDVDRLIHVHGATGVDVDAGA